MTKKEHEYVLGTGDDELVRLGFQHLVWTACAHRLWERAGFARGQRLLDLGAGPGYASQDLAQIVGGEGEIIAVDGSERFMAHLGGQPRHPGAGRITCQVIDVQALSLQEASLDGAYARWVLCFLPAPDKAVAAVARALKPGGVFAVQDYFNYRGMRLAPKSAAFERAIDAVEASWRRAGGDPEVGLRLPGIMARHGLTVREVRPLVRIAHPGALLWRWPETFLDNYLPKLVEAGLLSDAEVRACHHDWALRTADPTAFFSTPPQVEIIAERK